MRAFVHAEVDGHVALITLDRPEARNAINGDVARDFESVLDRLEADGSVRVAILSANTAGQERPVFCAGADLKAVSTGDSGLSTRKGGFAGFVYRERRFPVIAAVDGLATAGGCEIVLACDMVVASERSSFGLAEVRRNLIAAAGGLFRLPRAVGRAVAMEAILTGEPLPATRAHQLGLVNRLVAAEQVTSEARSLADLVAAAAPLAVAASRRVVLASAYEDDDTLRRMSDTEIAAIMRSEDTREGLAAFIEKRPPRWQGH
jgi:enoyl-CoA hydratase